MQGRLTPLGVFIKWVLIPVALAAIGYFVIGPNIGKGVFERLKAEPKGPSVDVSVQPTG
ncbi:MAG: hypothetical protein ACAH95_10945 [Fimbriimonas sp.]